MFSVITLLIFEGLMQVFWEVSGDGHSFAVVNSGLSASGSIKQKNPIVNLKLHNNFPFTNTAFFYSNLTFHFIKGFIEKVI